MIATHAIRLLMALTILVSVVLRPPGTMLVLDGDTISYEICTGGEPEYVTVALGGDPQQKMDLGCDFFASHIADIPVVAPDVAPILVVARCIPDPAAPQVVCGHDSFPHFSPRAPPHLS